MAPLFNDCMFPLSAVKILMLVETNSSSCRGEASLGIAESPVRL